MAVWINTTTGKHWDDGGTSSPGDPDFSQEAVIDHWGVGKFNYFCTPNWVAPAVEVAPEEE